MAESVDALVSNTSRFTPVPVRPRLWVLRGEKREFLSFFIVACMGNKRGSKRSSARKRLMLPKKDI
ncbi:MAG: hypothetical protein IIX38_03385, partial [Alistipes sp.]|nr:hypothetical protein [Alistipes sp.]